MTIYPIVQCLKDAGRDRCRTHRISSGAGLGSDWFLDEFSPSVRNKTADCSRDRSGFCIGNVVLRTQPKISGMWFWTHESIPHTENFLVITLFKVSIRKCYDNASCLIFHVCSPYFMGLPSFLELPARFLRKHHQCIHC